MVKSIDILEFEYHETTSKVEKFLLLRQFENCFAIDFSEFSGLQNFGIFLLKIALFKGVAIQIISDNNGIESCKIKTIPKV